MVDTSCLIIFRAFFGGNFLDPLPVGCSKVTVQRDLEAVKLSQGETLLQRGMELKIGDRFSFG